METKDWRDLREWMVSLLKRAGAGVDEWNARIAAAAPADEPALREWLSANGVTGRVQARKTCVALLTPRRTFAIVKPTSRTRVDLGLRLDGATPGGILQPANGLGNDTINVRVGLRTPDDVGDEVVAVLRRAYDASA